MADYETLQKKRNLAVGVFVLLGVMALIYMIAKFNELPLAYSRMKSFVIEVNFPTVAGVQKNTPVQFCGYSVGKVVKINPPEILKDPVTERIYHQVTVKMAIGREYNTIPSNIEVKLMRRGLGSSYIELVLDPTATLKPFYPDRPESTVLMDKMVLTGSTGTTNDFFPKEVRDKLDELIEVIIVLVENSNDFIGNQENKENFHKTMANLAEATEQASATLEELQKFASAGTTAISNTDTHIQKVASSMVIASDELAGSIVELRGILTKINSGQGTVGRIINDGKLYESLLESTDQLQAILKEVKDFVKQSRKEGLPLKLK